MARRSDGLIELLLIAGLGGVTLYQYFKTRPVNTATLTTGGPTNEPVRVAPTGPLGIRNNNPGNIRPSLIPWNGQVGTNQGYLVFDTAISGIRAMYKNLISYQDLHGIKTIRAIGNRWAPVAENGMKTAAWITNVANFAGIPQDRTVNLHDFGTATAIVKGIIGAENGREYVNHYPSDAFVKAWGAI